MFSRVFWVFSRVFLELQGGALVGSIRGHFSWLDGWFARKIQGVEV